MAGVRTGRWSIRYYRCPGNRLLIEVIDEIQRQMVKDMEGVGIEGSDSRENTVVLRQLHGQGPFQNPPPQDDQ